MEGGRVESRNGATKTPTHLPTYTRALRRHKGSSRGRAHERIRVRDNSLPFLICSKSRRCQHTTKSTFPSTKDIPERNKLTPWHCCKKTKQKTSHTLLLKIYAEKSNLRLYIYGSGWILFDKVSPLTLTRPLFWFKTLSFSQLQTAPNSRPPPHKGNILKNAVIDIAPESTHAHTGYNLFLLLSSWALFHHFSKISSGHTQILLPPFPLLFPSSSHQLWIFPSILSPVGDISIAAQF